MVDINSNQQASGSNGLDNIRSYLLALVHAEECVDFNCTLVSCIQMKEMLNHCRRCLATSTCPICREFMALCRQHSKTCDGDFCSIPNCEQFRLKRAEYDSVGTTTHGLNQDHCDNEMNTFLNQVSNMRIDNENKDAMEM